MKNKWIVIGLIILLAAAAVVFSRGEKNKPQATARENKPVPIITGTADTQSIDYVLHQVGTLIASREVTIRTETPGKVVGILFKEGGDVGRGDLLVRIDDVKIKAEIQNLQGKVEQLQVRLKNRQKSLERNRALVEQNLVSEEKFDDMLTEIDELKSQILQSEASLNRLKESLSDTLIRAPFDGTAGSRNFSIGHYLKVGDPVVSLVDLNTLEIEFKVPEKYKRNLLLDQDVNLSVDAYPDTAFKGRISFIDPVVDQVTRTFLIKARVPNQDHRLSPGMFVRAELITETRADALTVPWESVIQTETETYVYSTDGKTAKKHLIKLGKVVENRAEIIEPTIAKGDSVIVEGKFAVKDGATVYVSANKPIAGPEAEKTGEPRVDTKK